MSKHCKNKKYGRRVKKINIFFTVIILFAVFWAFENYTFKVTKTDIITDKVSEDIKIVHISDLHTNTYGQDNRYLISAVKKQAADLIFVTGDMYTGDIESSRAPSLKFITALTDIAPVYFVPGEHDNSDDFLYQLYEAGVHVLCYKKEAVTVKGNALTIYGIDNVYFGENFDLLNAFDRPDDARLNILLAHIPNLDSYADFGADLIFCGDTHGGVAQLPFFGPLTYNGEWLPEFFGKKTVTDKGLFEKNGAQMYVTGGLGNYPFPARLFNRPEVSVITIKNK